MANSIVVIIGTKAKEMAEEDYYSTNERIAKVCGYRKEGTQPLFQPCDLGYACPICGNASEELHWSEYKYCLWCPVCNLDIPSALCVKYHRPRLDSEPLDPRSRIERATEVFLDSVETAKKMEFIKPARRKNYTYSGLKESGQNIKC